MCGNVQAAGMSGSNAYVHSGVLGIKANAFQILQEQ